MHLYRYTIRAISDQLRGRFFFSYVAQMSYDFFFVYICGCHTRRGWHRPTKMYSNIPVRLFFLAERRQETINQEGEKRFKFRNQSRKKKELRERPFPVSTPKSYANSARPNANRIEANLGTVILKSLSRRARSISLTKVRDDGTVRISRALPPSVHPFHLIKKRKKRGPTSAIVLHNFLLSFSAGRPHSPGAYRSEKFCRRG